MEEQDWFPIRRWSVLDRVRDRMCQSNIVKSYTSMHCKLEKFQNGINLEVSDEVEGARN